MLVDAGANLEVAQREHEDGHTALHAAAANSCIECMQHLVTAGANVNAADSRGYNALHHTIDYYKEPDSSICPLLQLLLDAGTHLEVEITKERPCCIWQLA